MNNIPDIVQRFLVKRKAGETLGSRYNPEGKITQEEQDAYYDWMTEKVDKYYRDNPTPTEPTFYDPEEDEYLMNVGLEGYWYLSHVEGTKDKHEKKYEIPSTQDHKLSSERPGESFLPAWQYGSPKFEAEILRARYEDLETPGSRYKHREIIQVPTKFYHMTPTKGVSNILASGLHLDHRSTLSGGRGPASLLKGPSPATRRRGLYLFDDPDELAENYNEGRGVPFFIEEETNVRDFTLLEIIVPKGCWITRDPEMTDAPQVIVVYCNIPPSNIKPIARFKYSKRSPKDLERGGHFYSLRGHRYKI